MAGSPGRRKPDLTIDPATIDQTADLGPCCDRLSATSDVWMARHSMLATTSQQANSLRVKAAITLPPLRFSTTRSQRRGLNDVRYGRTRRTGL